MTDTSKAAMKLALEFVSDIQRGKYKGDAEEVITAIKQALAAPVQEPWKERFIWLVSQHWVEPEATFRLGLEETDDSCNYERQIIDAIDKAASISTPPAAQPAPVQATMKLESSSPGYGPAPKQKLSVRHVSLIDEGKTSAQPAVPDAFGTREGEHPQYIQGWNDCRAEMLKGMK